MNTHIKQIYILHLGSKVPIDKLRIYVAAWGIHEEIEIDEDEGWTLQYDETYRYKTIQYFVDNFLGKNR